MADKAVSTRKITPDEMWAVFKHAEDNLKERYAGKPLPSEAEGLKILQDEIGKITGVRPQGPFPTEVASTHDEGVKKILKDMEAKYGKSKQPAGVEDLIKALPTPPKAAPEATKER